MGKSGTDYNIKYEVIDEELLTSFTNDLRSVYGLEPSRWENPSGKTGKLIPFIRLRSKIAYEDLLRYASYYSKDWNIKEPMLNAPLEIKKEFLKALFDDEGSVIPQKKNPFVRLYSINHNGLLQIQEMLKLFQIESRIIPGFGMKRNVFALTIKEIKSFKEEIGFNLKRKQEKLTIQH